MSWNEILTQIVIPLISGFIGGSIGNVVIQKYRDSRKYVMKYKDVEFKVVGDVVNGEKK